MASAVKPIRVKVSRLMEKIQNMGSLSVEIKKALAAIVRQGTVRYEQLADQAASGTTTTLQASTYLTHKVEAGRKYRIKVFAKATNGTAANGLKLGINVSGTQTSARYDGEVGSVDITNAATTRVFARAALSSGAQTVADADTGSYLMFVSATLVPQSDGVLDVRFCENANGNGTAILKQDSYLEVTEIE